MTSMTSRPSAPADLRQLVGQRDVDRAEGVLQQLGHLGRAGRGHVVHGRVRSGQSDRGLSRRSRRWRRRRPRGTASCVCRSLPGSMRSGLKATRDVPAGHETALGQRADQQVLGAAHVRRRGQDQSLTGHACSTTVAQAPRSARDRVPGARRPASARRRSRSGPAARRTGSPVSAKRRRSARRAARSRSWSESSRSTVAGPDAGEPRRSTSIAEHARARRRGRPARSAGRRSRARRSRCRTGSGPSGAPARLVAVPRAVATVRERARK